MKRQSITILTIVLLATAILLTPAEHAGATESVYDVIYRQQHMQNGGSSDSSNTNSGDSGPKDVLPVNQGVAGHAEPSGTEDSLSADENSAPIPPEQGGQEQGTDGETADLLKDTVNQGDTDLSLSKDNHVWLFIEALLKLVLSVGVIIAIIYFGAKLLQLQRNGTQKHHNIQTIGVHALGQNKTMQLIRVADKIYIIGVGENIQLIKELSHEESQDMIKQFQEQMDQIQQPFNGLSNQFERIFKDRLSEFKKKNGSSQHDTQDNDQRASL